MKIKLALIVLLFEWSSVYSQFLPFNGDFDIFNSSCNNVPNSPCSGCCPSFDEGCVTNWHVSHGTPNFLLENGNYFVKLATYWADGEGLWASCQLRPNTNYTIKFWTRTSVAGLMLHVKAGRGLKLMNSPSGCQGPVPSNGYSEYVRPPSATWHIPGAGWTQSTISYTTSNFSPSTPLDGLWFFATKFEENSAAIDIDGVSIQENYCLNDIISNSGNIIQGGGGTFGMLKGRTIQIGSTAGTGGSGTVTSTGTLNEQVIASNEIVILPATDITLTDGSFEAWIEPCDGGTSESSVRRPNTIPRSDSKNALPGYFDPAKHAIDYVHTSNDSLAIKSVPIPTENRIAIFPNPSSDKVRISLTKNETVKRIDIYSMDGKLVKKLESPNSAGHYQYEVDVSDIGNGHYLLKIFMNNQVLTKNLHIVR